MREGTSRGAAPRVPDGSRWWALARSRWRAVLAMLLLAAGAAVAAPVEAQRPGAQGARPDMERQLRQRFDALVQRELGLDDAAAAELAAVVEEYQEPRRELSRRQRQLQRRMTSTGTILSADEAVSVLEELVAVRQAEVDLLAAEQEALLGVLTAPQLVRFYTLRESLARRVQQFRRDRGGREGGGRPPFRN